MEEGRISSGIKSEGGLLDLVRKKLREIFDRTALVECQGLKPDSMAFMREEVVRQWKP